MLGDLMLILAVQGAALAAVGGLRVLIHSAVEAIRSGRRTGYQVPSSDEHLLDTAYAVGVVTVDVQ